LDLRILSSRQTIFIWFALLSWGGSIGPALSCVEDLTNQSTVTKIVSCLQDQAKEMREDIAEIRSERETLVERTLLIERALKGIIREKFEQFSTESEGNQRYVAPDMTAEFLTCHRIIEDVECGFTVHNKSKRERFLSFYILFPFGRCAADRGYNFKIEFPFKEDDVIDGVVKFEFEPLETVIFRAEVRDVPSDLNHFESCYIDLGTGVSLIDVPISSF